MSEETPTISRKLHDPPTIEEAIEILKESLRPWIEAIVIEKLVMREEKYDPPKYE